MHSTTPSAHRSPTLSAVTPQKKKRKKVVGETSSLRKSLKVTIKQKRQSTTLISSPSDDQEWDDIAEATILSLTLHKTAIAIEAQENVAKAQEKLEEAEIAKMVKGDEDEESYASEFADSMLNDDDDDFDDNKDDDGKKDDTDHTLVRTQETGSMETRKEKMQTPIPSPNGSLKKNLFSAKTLSQELTETDVQASRLHDSVHGKEICNLKRVVVDTIIQERDALQAEVPVLVSKEFADQAPWIIEELFKTYVSNNVIQIHSTTSTSTATNSSEWDAWVEETVIDEDEVIPEDVTPKMIDEFKNIDKRIPTIYDRARMEATLNDMMSNPLRNAKEITEVVIVTTDQHHGLDFMKQIIMMRENDKPYSFSKADFKYLSKNDIEDLYYLCLNKKVNFGENKLKNSLITFIRSCVIWERVYDFQLGIESYQIRVNLTAPTLTFLSIEAHDPYSIVEKPNTSLIYLNNKEEKRVMYLAKIVKFCDATLEKVLKEV
ncbi:hypothetical protein Tco_0879361 [Tanacetum coccineum]